MLPKVATQLVVMISVVFCQIDGEFWWLKKDITKLRRGTAPPPKFDDINELDTDETAKIVFREYDIPVKSNLTKTGKSLNNQDSVSAIHFRDETELSKPFLHIYQMNNTNSNIWKKSANVVDNEENRSIEKLADQFQFIFPTDNNLLWTDGEKALNEKTKPLQSVNTVKPFSKLFDDKNSLKPENICTYIEKLECIRNEGTLYERWTKPNMYISNTAVICCILPISTTPITKIFFPGTYWDAKRHKRSNTDKANPGLMQRNTLMSRGYAPKNQRVRTTTPATHKKVNQKVVNSNEYSGDPYWNVKNPNIRNPNMPTYQDPDAGYDYGSQTYSDEYTHTDELPQPGLLDIYSDHRQTQPSWTHNKNKWFSYGASDSGEEEEEVESSFGYSTVDPRLDHRLTSASQTFRRRPVKLTAAPPKLTTQNPQTQTISFHSNPDFEVLQGFKLLNLGRRKNRFVRKTPGTTEEYDKKCDNGSTEKGKPSKFVTFTNDNYEDDLFENDLKQKLIKVCGKTIDNQGNYENGREEGVVEFGEHPWIALVVPTKSERVILCYATLVHSRVAVSAADCVYGKSPGEVSIVAGVRNLEEDLARAQRRMTSIVLHSDYTPGNLKHNLALLHWIRPLTLHATVRPACLAEPHSDDSCVFVGWGGYDKESHSDLRWQRASVLAPQDCERLSKLDESDALCAAVQSESTVTGAGGPLLCRRDGRWFAVGVAAWRDGVVMLLPPYDWLLRQMTALRIV